MSAVNPATSLVVSPQRRLGVTLCLVAALAACQKSDKLPTTAERLKNVEVRQQVEPESYLPRKSVDYMATMKDLKDAPDKSDAAKAEPKAARITLAPAAPAPAPTTAVTAPKLPEIVKAAPPEARLAAVTPAAVPAPATGVAEAAKKSDAPKPDSAAAAAESTYFAAVRSYINSVTRYPTSREARSQRPAGTVQVGIELSRDGKLRDVKVEKSAESIILDQAALATVRQGSYPAFPANAWPGQASWRFSISLEYSLAAGG